MNESDLNSAREYAASVNQCIADEALTATYYADHITMQKREEIKRYNLRLAQEIREGKHDNNFTIKQRMYYYLTGKSVPFMT